MNLFEIIPQNYFGLFGGKNRTIYIDALIILFDLLESDEAIISKTDYIKALREKETAIEAFSYEDEDISDLDNEGILMNTIGAKASFVVRRLEETGWIDIALDPQTFEETIVLPQYSILIIKAFKDIISDEESPYLSLVHSTYSELKLEDEEQDDYMYSALIKSYENTRKLKVELITVTHSIRIFQNKLSKLFETNKVLHDYFDIYKRKILDRYYHPLKTFDSVARFKRAIIKILDRWLNDKEIRSKLVDQARLSNFNVERNELELDIIDKINYISDTYERLNSLISDIDKENNEYTKSSTNKILYLNNSDKTVKGHLENILKTYSQNINNTRALKKIVSQMQSCIYFYEQGYINSDSITLPILRRYRTDGDPMPIISMDDFSYEAMKEFLDNAGLVYTDKKVYGFMEEAFGDLNEVHISDITLVNDDAFICLILACLKKDEEACFYYVEEVDKSKVATYGYIVPNFKFIRKD